ncbi:efflux RND transporter periplasmic adaptor subunit, partial [Reinekea sp.]|jgi:HlyD family secretion protein|uniref:efflux RND transporter periplasmic adaptor subunit n=1 Tax=Reinekea sp. TaxID=1970455 RepID=UPI003989BDC1
MNARAQKIVYPIIVLVIGVAVAGWLVKTPKSSISTVDQSEIDPLADAPTITALNAQEGTYAPQLLLYSQLKSAQQVKISSSIATDIISVDVNEGDRVEKGARLVVLDTAPLQRQLDQLESKRLDLAARFNLEKKQFDANKAALPIEQNLVDIAQRSVNRLTNLKSQNLTSNADIENSERALQNQILSLQNRELSVSRFEAVEQQYRAQFAELDSQITQARSALEKAFINAPFSGQISKIKVQNGANVTVGAELLTLVDLRQQQLVAWVAAKAIENVIINTPLTGYVESNNSLKPVVLKSIDPTAEAGSLRILFSLLDPSAALTLNRYYRLWLELPKTNAFAVPESAIYSNAYVYVVEDSELKRVDVSIIGDRQEAGELWRLVQGDINNNKILVTRLQDATQGLKVRLANSIDPIASR